jgi:flagellar biosynthesis protein FlhB
MSGSKSDEQRNLPPTRRRLKKARDEGKALHSKELTAAVSLLATFSAAALMLPWVAGAVARLMQGAFRLAAHPRVPAALALAWEGFVLLATFAMLLLGVAALTSVVAARLQTGPIFSIEPVKPKLERLNPVQNAKQIFSLKSLVLVGMMLVKVVVVGLGLWLISKGILGDAVRVVHAGVGGGLAVLQAGIVKFAMWALFAFVLLAALDYLYQRYNFTKELRMSFQEVRREHREEEGDPIFKQARKQAMRAPSPAEQLRFVRVAATVLASADGRVIPLFYNDAPGRPAQAVVVLRASGAVASEVLRLAREHRVPLAFDTTLVARLWPASSDGAKVPAALQAEVVRAVLLARARARPA